MRGVGWSDEKNISDLGQKLIISTRSVFLAQSHQISRAELENKKARQLASCRAIRGGPCVRTLS